MKKELVEKCDDRRPKITPVPVGEAEQAALVGDDSRKSGIVHAIALDDLVEMEQAEADHQAGDYQKGQEDICCLWRRFLLGQNTLFLLTRLV